jgi:tRNA pseudouridine55 synthase
VNSPIPDPRSPIPDGVLVVDKTEGPTSHDVVKFARRALGVSRIGHTGTLDPMATGVLPLVIGRATRLAQFLTASDKSYEATVAFGRTTDTCDATGKVTATSDVRPTPEQLASALVQFRGTFDQTPPAYSAKNIDGERSYDLARKNARRAEPSDAPARRAKAVSVTVKRLELLSFDGDTARLEMQVTAGFYVRSLAHDLGEALGCGAHLQALRRTAVGAFVIEHATPLTLINNPDVIMSTLSPPELAVADWPVIVLDAEAERRVRNGLAIADTGSGAERARAHGPEGDLLALLVRAGDHWRPEKVFDWS